MATELEQILDHEDLAQAAHAEAMRELLADAKLRGYKLVVEVDGHIIHATAEELEARLAQDSGSKTS